MAEHGPSDRVFVEARIRLARDQIDQATDALAHARAEFERVVDFLDEQGVWFTQGCEGDAIYHGGHSMEALADAFEERFKPSAPGGDESNA